ncbi:MAG: NADH dehydrogenase subunit D [Anaerolineaceae bacterium 4572_32.1]|nr:MAG: NADH dehydrogenase subunit D [Anaerolineaceae bacterium 4572_32.1]
MAKVREQPAAEKVSPLAARLKEEFDGAVIDDSPNGIVLAADRLVDVAAYLRETPDLDYNHLSGVTSVDYDEYFEIVYHFNSLKKQGEPVILKVRTDKENPLVPSLTPTWPGAAFQEREIWDLMGIRFEGHPNHRRLVLWEGFEGHPLRKDWREPYFEADSKPFSSRWPEGQHIQVEERTPLGRNVQYPEGWDPDEWEPVDEMADFVERMEAKLGENGDSLKTQKVVVNMGPQHPSTHGVFRMKLVLDGEIVIGLEPVFGYMHRSHEKIAERNLWVQNIPFCGRLDYISTISNAFPYVLAVEKLLGTTPPERARYLRVMVAELARILNHFISIGFLFNDLGAYFTPVQYCLEEREFIMDWFEMISGSRMMGNYYRFGGVTRDVSPEAMRFAETLVRERIPRAIDEIDRFLSENEIFLSRSVGVGVLSLEDAIKFSTTGPVMRASGLPYDIRKADPYSIYDRFKFDIVTEPAGDVYARYLVRLREMRESAKILEQALEQIKEGPIQEGRKRWNQKVPAGESYGRVESPKGELGFYLVSDGGTNAYRYHVRSPCLINLTALEKMCVGQKVADVVVILGSIDIVLGEVDR